jgi:hypothetical protein
MAQVGNCYYIPIVETLFKIDSITSSESTNYNSYHFGVLHKFNSVKTGYSNESVAFSVSEDFFKGRVLVDNTIFAKITKLLQINNIVCYNILKEAPRSVTDHENKMAFISNTWDGYAVCYCDQCVNFSNNGVILSEGPMYLLIYIPVEYFFKIKEQCEKTIKLIDEIWPSKNS